jgi:hypothetical protein
VPSSTTACRLAAGLLRALLAGLAGFTGQVRADDIEAPRAAAPPETIVIMAKPEAVADREMARRVQMALHQDPFLDDERITVHVVNGFVTLEGIVLDDWDLRRAVRISARTPGAKGVTDSLELHRIGDD